MWRWKAVPRRVKDSLSLTTLKGIPRIIRTKNKVFKCIWIFSTICLSLGAIYHTYTLINKYINPSSYTTVKTTYDQHKENFPSIGICPLTPFGNFVPDGLPTYKDFYTLMSKRISQFEEKGSKVNKQFLSILTEASTYYEWIGEENAKKVGYQMDSFIIYCRIFYDISDDRYDPCDKFVKIDLIPDPNTFNCYTLNFNVSKEIYKVEILLSLGEISKDSEFYFNVTKSLLTEGIKLLLFHKSEDIPNIEERGFLVSKGDEIIISTTPVYKLLKPYPFTNCVQGKNMYSYQGSKIVSYYYSHCYKRSLQKFIITKLNCSLRTLFILPEYEDRKKPSCKFISENITMEVSNLFFFFFLKNTHTQSKEHMSYKE